MSEKRKKILFVVTHFCFSNGIATTLRTLIDNMDQNKFEIHVLSLFKLDKAFIVPIKNKIILHKGFGFYFRGLNRLVGLIPNKILYRLFIREKFDLEIAYQFFGNVTDILSASPNPNKVSWLHIINPNSERELFSKIDKFKKIITVSESVKHKLIQFGILNSYCCYNVIDEVSIINKSQEELDVNIPKKNIIITVGRISPEKGVLRQVKCINSIVRKIKNSEFWIIGDGPEFDKVQNYIKNNNLEKYIKLFGSQTNPYKYMAKADLFLCGSYREGFSTACQEAAILGIPIITTEVDGAQELIKITECGAVVDNNEQAIKDILLNILGNNTLIESWKSVALKNRYKLFKSERIKKIERFILDH